MRGGRAVYPRTRGATYALPVLAVVGSGLSPHARGNQVDLSGDYPQLGSIPARAGQPRRSRGHHRPHWVYPRTRGATHQPRHNPRSVHGLSPHARGNHSSVAGESGVERSIPARAGQPAVHPNLADSVGVYPRTRGATLCRRDPPRLDAGLSPHARGNHIGNTPGDGQVRSIPARAGQPEKEGDTSRLVQVYPRTRGATALAALGGRVLTGLSPHARGNRRRLSRNRRHHRSIPARAGQPYTYQWKSGSQAVYPRTRGATRARRGAWCAPPGLSPHARGNPGRGPEGCGLRRSIPARAGQPSCGVCWDEAGPVYPRTRGATLMPLKRGHVAMGLSPHARGNRLRWL